MSIVSSTGVGQSCFSLAHLFHIKAEGKSDLGALPKQFYVRIFPKVVLPSGRVVFSPVSRQFLACYFFFKLLNEFYYIYSCTTIITTKFYIISIPNSQRIPPPPQSISFGNHKFFKVCESVSVLQRSSLCCFFRFHM